MPPITITVGSATVRVYPREAGGRWDIVYRLHGRRVRESRGSEEAATGRAKVVAKLLNAGRANTLTLQPADALSYTEAMRMLRESRTPLAAAIEEYVEAKRRIGLRGSLVDAAEMFRRARPEELRDTSVTEAVAAFLAEKKADSIHWHYLSNLKRTLERFAREVPGEIGVVTPAAIKAWLSTLGATGRTLANYRAWVVQLFRWCRANGMLPHDRQTAAEQVRLPKYGKARVEPFRPAELEQLLTSSPSALLPWYAIGAFAGCRPSEICRLDWSAFDWGRKVIRIGDDVAMKTRQARRVPIEPALSRWLSAIRKPTGRVMTMGEVEAARKAVKHAINAGVKWRKNGLRVSHGSYLYAIRKNEFEVAARMGHDPATFWREYREDVDETVARAWFGTMPAAPDPAPTTEKVSQSVVETGLKK